MIEARISYIDIKESIEKAYTNVSFEDVTYDTAIDEYGNSYEYDTDSTLICERFYEFQQPTTIEIIFEFIESERAKL